MPKEIGRKVLIWGLDTALFLTVWVGRVFSAKGLAKSALVALVFITLGRGAAVESSDRDLIALNPTVAVESFRYIPIVKNPRVEFPLISAKAVLVSDVANDELLFESASTEKFAPASTTKLMTGLVALDLYEKGEELTVPALCAQVPGNSAHLMEGEKILLEDLMNAALIASANDAACVLASSDGFIERMNAKAVELGLEDTHFTNVVGFDADEHYSTAQDLRSLAMAVRENPWFREIYGRHEYFFDSGLIARKIRTTNHLLWLVPGSKGIKTGTTAQAGEVLVYEYADDRKDLIIIVMGSSDRFRETREILEWIEDRYVWIRV